MKKKIFKTKYGYFNEHGDEYIITTPHTPLPWVNIICPGKLGVAVTQSGDGFTWYEHAGVNVLTRWIQDFSQQNWGKFIYLFDNNNNTTWSASYSPCKIKGTDFKTVHGIGYSIFTHKKNGILSNWYITVDPKTQAEVWSLELTNQTVKNKDISVVPYLEWCLGNGAFHHREIHQCFMRTRVQGNTITAEKSVWDIPSRRGKWNRSYPYTAFFSSSKVPVSWQLSKKKFLGFDGNIARPAFNFNRSLADVSGSNDHIASMCIPVSLKPGQGKTLYFTCGVTVGKKNISVITGTEMKKIKTRVRRFWAEHFEGMRVSTPSPSIDILVNNWLKYQVFSSRIFGRSGYYVQGGVYGYREIQDLLTVIPLEPGIARKRLIMYAENQYRDLSIPHHFDLVTGEKGKSLWSDDMLWLPYITTHYLKETGDFSILDEKIRYIDSPGKEMFYTHCVKAIKKVLDKTGETNLPLILEGDWNDGLSAVGIRGKGESVWLGIFLTGILKDFVYIAGYKTDHKRKRYFSTQLKKMKNVLNKKAWDGKWFKRARCDNGKWIGTSKNRAGKIFLNTQTWSIINDVITDRHRLEKAVDSMEKKLYTREGPVLFSPPYLTPDEDIGYITRYNPGVRENGGVYTHAANWALQAEAKLGRIDKVNYIYQKICPVIRSNQDPDRYQAEPYVTSGNIEYHPSPSAGKGGWSWYTSSGAWLYKVVTEWMLGIRPEFHGLVIEPAVGWNFSVEKIFRKHKLNIEVVFTLKPGKRIFIDGRLIDKNYIPYSYLTKPAHNVVVKINKQN